MGNIEQFRDPTQKSQLQCKGEYLQISITSKRQIKGVRLSGVSLIKPR